MANEFRSLMVRTEGNMFEKLFISVQFEQVGKGRQGTVLTKPDGTRGIPIVRTTTKYGSPAHSFGSVHERLAQNIQECASLPVGFNNALIENYNNAYTTMGFHSDQDLDLADGSTIAVFSCYQHPELATTPRKLVIESKEPGGGTFEVPLVHNSVVVFTLETNRRFRHKIVLDTAANPPENQWLGVTFRTSRTFVQFCEGEACFEDGAPLTLVGCRPKRCVLPTAADAALRWRRPPHGATDAAPALWWNAPRRSAADELSMAMMTAVPVMHEE